MAQFELIMPKMGESVAEATIIKWVKNVGDTITADESVLEIATDKVDSEVPSPVAGKLAKILFKEGDVVQVGTAVALLETDAAASVADTPVVETPVAASAKAAPVSSGNHTEHTVKETAKNTDFSGTSRFYSPLVKSIATAEGISAPELETIPGSGLEGRVTKNDILNYLSSRKQGVNAVKASVPTPAAAPTPLAAAVSPRVAGPNEEIIEMDRMRKLIADHMIMSKQTSPHVTSFVEADVTNMVRWRERVKKEFEKKHGEKITFTPILIEAVAKAILDFPMINVSVNGNQIIVKKNINIGMATALPSGNLIVPVIKNADQMNLLGLTKVVNDLANRARNNKLSPDDIQGGTYTVSNVGTFGNVMGTPIINQPQVAILALGAIRKKPAVIETPEGDMIAIRHMMFLSHSYDHRVVDGALGGQFVRRVGDYLEQFDMNRTF